MTDRIEIRTRLHQAIRRYHALPEWMVEAALPADAMETAAERLDAVRGQLASRWGMNGAGETLAVLVGADGEQDITRELQRRLAEMDGRRFWGVAFR